MPYEPSEAHGKTRKANTARRSRQWVAVYESSRKRGDDEGTAITKANGVVKKQWVKTNPSGRKPVDHRPENMKVAGATSLHEAVGFLKEASGCTPEAMRRQLLGQAPVNERALAEMLAKKPKKKTASYHHKRRITTGKVPTTSLADLRDLRSTLISQERRMTSEGGKSPVGVSAKKVWKKHTRRGGRSTDVRESLRRQLTFHVPSGDPEGVKTVQFRTEKKSKG